MKTFSYVFAFTIIWLACAQNCDDKEILIYKDIKCKTKTKKGGKVYKEQENIPYDLTYSSCNTGCSCRESSILCDELDCPELLGYVSPACYNNVLRITSFTHFTLIMHVYHSGNYTGLLET
ncbi:hypothetical protein GWI33_000893 [Rhynchophorus ferrugineus]|uniref:Uncharacterized protein n=1 Tax=Rhynchophorus ferrugineus TaxID=354439 RepID=A0A834HLN7_RHYFE|nr:hypothetical protein GWI33_000893 [Rhynchophorus ferrugineus]